jgi:Fe-S oxidoreductase
VSVVKVLQDLGMEIIFPEKQSCCGKPVSAMGNLETARRIARQNLEAFEAGAPDVDLAACPACTEALRGYAELLKEDAPWRERAEGFARRVQEFCSFMAQEYERTGRLNPATGKVKVTDHDSCHMKRVLRISREPRRLLAAAGYDLVEMKDGDKCCGMSGAFGLKYTELSMPILKQKIHNIRESGAEIVAVACSGCMVQIQGGLDKQAPGMKMKCIADILAETIE